MEPDDVCKQWLVRVRVFLWLHHLPIRSELFGRSHPDYVKRATQICHTFWTLDMGACRLRLLLTGASDWSVYHFITWTTEKIFRCWNYLSKTTCLKWYNFGGYSSKVDRWIPLLSSPLLWSITSEFWLEETGFVLDIFCLSLGFCSSLLLSQQMAQVVKLESLGSRVNFCHNLLKLQPQAPGFVGKWERNSQFMTCSAFSH